MTHEQLQWMILGAAVTQPHGHQLAAQALRELDLNEFAPEARDLLVALADQGPNAHVQAAKLGLYPAEGSLALGLVRQMAQRQRAGRVKGAFRQIGQLGGLLNGRVEEALAQARKILEEL